MDAGFRHWHIWIVEDRFLVYDGIIWHFQELQIREGRNDMLLSVECTLDEHFKIEEPIGKIIKER